MVDVLPSLEAAVVVAAAMVALLEMSDQGPRTRTRTKLEAGKIILTINTGTILVIQKDFVCSYVHIYVCRYVIKINDAHNARTDTFLGNAK